MAPIMQIVRTAPGLPLHVMRYEDMARKTFPTFRALVEFLQMPLDKARLRKAIRFTDFSELKSQEKKNKFVEARPDGAVPFFRSGKAGGWREVLSDDLVAKLIEAHGETMREFGYIDAKGRLTDT